MMFPHPHELDRKLPFVAIIEEKLHLLIGLGESLGGLRLLDAHCLGRVSRSILFAHVDKQVVPYGVFCCLIRPPKSCLSHLVAVVEPVGIPISANSLRDARRTKRLLKTGSRERSGCSRTFMPARYCGLRAFPDLENPQLPSRRNGIWFRKAIRFMSLMATI